MRYGAGAELDCPVHALVWPFEMPEVAAAQLGAIRMKKELRRCLVAVYGVEGVIISVAAIDCPTSSNAEEDDGAQHRSGGWRATAVVGEIHLWM